MVCLENELRHSVVSEIVPKDCTSDSFVDYEGYSSKGFLPRVIDIMVIWIKFLSTLILWFLRRWCSILPSPAWPHPVYLDSWTLYSRSLHNTVLHRTLPSPADTFITEHHVGFGPASSFFLELFLCFSPIAYWTPPNLGGLVYWCHISLPFHSVHGVFEARILEWLAVPFSSGSCFVRIL